MENEEIKKILTSVKENLLKNKWIQVQDNVLYKIKMYLEVLLHLPLTFLNSDLRLIIFMFIFLLRLECDQSDEVVSLCNTLLSGIVHVYRYKSINCINNSNLFLFSDLLERSTIDVFQHIEPVLLLQQLPQNRIIQKTLEIFLRNCSYEILKGLIKFSIDSNKNMSFLLESMEHVKPKLNVHQRTIIKKAQKKLIKVMMKALPCKITKPDDMKMLNLIIKIDIANENINEELKDVVESTVHDIFMVRRIGIT